MSILGLGVDLVHIPRINSIVHKYGDRFLKRAFHPEEIATFKSKQGHPAFVYLASRWAVKESVFKAVGGKFRMQFPEIQIHHNNKGQPQLLIHGKARKVIVEEMGVSVDKTLVSISHEKDYAIANVILQK